MAASFEPAVAGEVARALGPMFAVPITAPEAVDRFAAIGFDRDEWAERYFAFRSAQLGRATAETVIATYFNFAPRRIHRYFPRVWEIADPAVVLDVLMDSVDAAMGRALVDFADTPELRELAGLLSDAAASAFEHPEGRALFAGHRRHSVARRTARADLARHARAARVPRRRPRRGAHRQRPDRYRSARAARGDRASSRPICSDPRERGRRRCGTRPSRSCAAAA